MQHPDRRRVLLLGIGWWWGRRRRGWWKLSVQSRVRLQLLIGKVLCERDAVLLSRNARHHRSRVLCLLPVRRGLRDDLSTLLIGKSALRHGRVAKWRPVLRTRSVVE